MKTHTFGSSDYSTARVLPLPLHAHTLLTHAAQVHASATVTSVALDGTITRQSYAQLAKAVDQRSAELQRQGLLPGDALVSFGLSSLDQLTWLYAALQQGVTTHLFNPQHRPEDLALFLQHLNPSLLLHDSTTADAARAFAEMFKDMALRDMAAPGVESTEAYRAPAFDEQTLSHVCYSSGTTGIPKVVAYTHRSTLLHAWACALPDAMALSSTDRVMPLMQNFHASAWGAPFVCPLVGAELVLVPLNRDPAQWFHWIEEHKITVLGAVSAHWLALAHYMRAHGLRFSTLRRTVVGGTRLPFEVALFIQDVLGVEVCHAWGMTETSPLATIERFDSNNASLRHGKPVFGIEMAVQDRQGGCSTKGTGELMVRGHWVAHYPEGDGEWLATGDFATLHDSAQLEVIDRMEDALVCNGNPLCSALIEHQARLVPGVADAALLVTGRDSNHCVLAWIAAAESDPAAVDLALQQHIASAFNGWVPTHCTLVESFPYTPSAKVQKHLLKEQVTRLHNNSETLAPRFSCRGHES